MGQVVNKTRRCKTGGRHVLLLRAGGHNSLQSISCMSRQDAENARSRFTYTPDYKIQKGEPQEILNVKDLFGYFVQNGQRYVVTALTLPPIEISDLCDSCRAKVERKELRGLKIQVA